MDFEKVKNNVNDLISGKKSDNLQDEKILSEEEKEKKRQEYLDILEKIKNYSPKIPDIHLEPKDKEREYDKKIIAKSNTLAAISFSLQESIRIGIIQDDKKIKKARQIINNIHSYDSGKKREPEEIKQIVQYVSEAMQLIANDTDREIDMENDRQALAN